MGNGYFTNPLVFLVDALFGLYILAVMIRFLLGCVRADFYNPISQALVRITNPALRPLRRIVPGLGGIDLAAIVLMIVLQGIAIAITTNLRGVDFNALTLVIVTLAELVGLLLNVFLFAILIQAVLSWVNPGAHNPVSSLLYSLTEPVLRPVRRFVPPMGGLDLSPLVALLAIQILRMLLLPPLLALAH